MNEETTETWQMTIGLEVHVQLRTETKMFCGCPNRYGEEPNTLVCPVCTGMPGALPAMNRNAFRQAVKAALALNCEIMETTRMDRKNYYYPDLPKNYQISQYDLPFSRKGEIRITPGEGGKQKTIGIRRVHLEEDAGKLIHPESDGEGEDVDYSLVDLNRAGVPLLEIVSEPDMKTPAEAYAYLQELKQLLQYIEVSDCSMEKGSLRCDTNISVSRDGRETGTRTEIKNLNSFKNVKKALKHEAERQISLLESGGEVNMETRTFDAETGKTEQMRSKEEEADYRYFPEPDLPSIKTEKGWVEKIRGRLPELPREKRQRYREEFGLSEDDANVLTAERSLAEYFEEALETYEEPKSIANWIMGEVLEYLNEENVEVGQCPIGPERIAKLAKLFNEDRVTSTASREIFQEMLVSEKDPVQIMEEKSLGKMGDRDELREIAKRVIDENEEPVRDYLDGKENAIQALMGGVMSRTEGRADPEEALKTLRDLLEERKEQ